MAIIVNVIGKWGNISTTHHISHLILILEFFLSETAKLSHK